MNIAFDIADLETLLEEADDRSARGDTALDAYFASLKQCPRIPPARQVEMAREYQREVKASQAILNEMVAAKAVFLKRILEQLQCGERLEHFVLLTQEQKIGLKAQGGVCLRSFFTMLQNKDAMLHPDLAHWNIRPSLILAWSRELLNLFAGLPQRPCISRIKRSGNQGIDDLARWSERVDLFERRRTGLRINQSASCMDRLRQHVERAEAHFSTLVEANIRLVIHIAKRYRNCGLSLEDLIGEGNLGLMKGIERFNPDRGFNLSTYVIFWIKQSMLQALMTQGHVVYFPPAVHELMRKIQRCHEAAFKAAQPEPSIEELARELCASPKDIEAALSMRQVLSFDQNVGEDDGGTLAQIFSPTDEGISLDESQTIRAALDRLLNILQAKEQQVIRLHFGLRDGHARSFDEVADIMKLSKERVRQIESKALARIRAEPAVQSEKFRFLAG